MTLRYICSLALLLMLSCNKQLYQQALVKKQQAVIRSYIQAEDNRDSLLLKQLLADTITSYWKMENPTRDKIIAFYKDYWTKNRYSKNNIQSVKAVANNAYRVHTFFEVQRLTADTAIHVESSILYKLNAAGKIVYVGKE